MGEGAVKAGWAVGVGVGGASRHRAAKRGERALDGAAVRREGEAWCGQWAAAWNAFEGEGAAAMVGDEVSMATARASRRSSQAARVEAARSHVGPMPSWSWAEAEGRHRQRLHRAWCVSRSSTAHSDWYGCPVCPALDAGLRRLDCTLLLLRAPLAYSHVVLYYISPDMPWQ